jgi:hypothetical protein
MRRTTKIIATALLFLGALSFEANAQTMSLGSWRAQAIPNYSTPFKNAACNGWTGACGCGPGWISACRHRCCRCVPC